MEFQTNPYIIWLLIPSLFTFILGLYIQSRPRKKPESNVLALIMFACAFWSLMDAIQMVSPGLTWQIFWHTLAFLAIVTIPTAWFFLAVRFSGYLRRQVEKARYLFYIIPILTFIAAATNGYTNLFFTSSTIVTLDHISELSLSAGPLFLVHTFYSYALIITGVLFIGMTLFSNFKKYKFHGYELLIGVLVPMVSNILFLFGVLPPGFPDPTPLAFTITGIAFARAIFSGGMLEVVSIAHDAVVAHLTSGVLVLDTEDRVMDLNPAALKILNPSRLRINNLPLKEVLAHDSTMLATLQRGLRNPYTREQDLVIKPAGKEKTYQTQVSAIKDEHDQLTGHVLQFTDISRQEQVEKNLETTKETMVSILDTLKDYYFETDVNGYILNINQSFCEHLGYKRKEDVIGKHFRHYTDPRSVRDVYLNFNKVFKNRETVEFFRYTYRTRDGTAYIGETTMSPLLEGDVVVGARGVLRNVTDRVLAEDQLRQAKEQVERRVDELSALNRIAAVSSLSLNLSTILDTLCVELTKIFPVRNAGIALLTPDKVSLEVVAFHSTDPQEKNATGMLLPYIGNKASQEVIDKKKTVVVQNSQEDSRTEVMADVSRLRGTKAIMIVPLMTRGKAIGTIGMPARDGDYIFSEAEVRLAETIASQIAAAIDNANLYARTENALGLVERDLEIGRRIQSSFFPEAIPEVPGWELAAHFEPARQVAGDFYDFFQFDNSPLTALVIADVCDKGVGAALFMVLFRSLLRAFSKTEINSGNISERLKNIISNTNNYIANVHGSSNMFATVFFGILDPDSGSLYYVNGGHEPPIILNKEGRAFRRLRPTGPAVGLFPDVGYQVEHLVLAPGDFLVGYTDGTIDARDGMGNLYSEERLLKYLQTPWTSMFSMVFELKNELHNYVNGEQQFDDITLISLRRKLTPEREQHAICRPASLDLVPEMSDFVRSAAGESELTPADALAFQQAVEEWCTYLIKHGYEGRTPGVLSLFFETEPDLARLIIRDDGLHVPPDPVETPHLPADGITYTRMGETGNQMVVVKNIQRQVRETNVYEWEFAPNI